MNRMITAIVVFIAGAAGLVPTAQVAAQTLPAGVTERAITVPGPVPLPGTLTVPPGNGPFPGVILVHGSGAGDRDETILENKPFRDLAWGLAQRGVVVLRYDKRARVQPMWYANRVFTVYEEVVEDALSALTLLRQQPEVNAARTFLLGHSLGGMLAPRIAEADGKLAGLVIMAGATRVHLPEQIERQFAYLQSIAGADSNPIKAARAQMEPGLAKIRALTPADTADASPIPGLGGTSARYWLDLAAYDPAVVMRGLHIPALVLQGLRDYQVPPDQLDDWLRVVGPRADITVKRYPALTHLFIPGQGTPSPAEYAKPGHVDPQVMIDIAAWVHHVDGKATSKP
jgi:dienelactone hydrolase